MKIKPYRLCATVALGAILLNTPALAAPGDPSSGGSPGSGPGGGTVTVPEPSTWLLMGAGVGALLVAARRRGKREP